VSCCGYYSNMAVTCVLWRLMHLWRTSLFIFNLFRRNVFGFRVTVIFFFESAVVCFQLTTPRRSSLELGTAWRTSVMTSVLPVEIRTVDLSNTNLKLYRCVKLLRLLNSEFSPSLLHAKRRTSGISTLFIANWSLCYLLSWAQYSHFGQADSRSDGQQITHSLCNTQLHYRLYKSPPLKPVLSQITPIWLSCVVKIHFNIILTHSRVF
jgi:hypothetical protein